MQKSQRAFTLIELSIALVIIGLLVGGVLVGRDLIRAAEVRAQISQIEKYQQAVNTFRGKYGYMPGDIPDPDATRYGFAARGYAGSIVGVGDGNAAIEGQGHGIVADGTACGTGEPVLFWTDLTYANGLNINLIGGSFKAYGNAGVAGSYGATSYSAGLSLGPPAKIGAGNTVYVWSSGGTNYYGLSAITWVNYHSIVSNPALTVKQAQAIDVKIDDGLPQSGIVVAQYVSGYVNGGYCCQLPNTGAQWAIGGGAFGNSGTSATTGSATTCYDNAGVRHLQAVFTCQRQTLCI